jgi:hypothetical protein
MGWTLYTQGRSSNFPIPTLRFSCYELGPLFIRSRLYPTVATAVCCHRPSREVEGKDGDDVAARLAYELGRGLHSSTSELSLSRFCH